jgi:hypothetical protein
MPLVEGQHAYVHDCQVKTCVYVLKHCQAKDKAKKLRLKMNIGCQAIRRQETQYKREQSKEKKHSKARKRRFYPQYGRQFYYEENLSMAWGKPQQKEMIA